MGFADCKDIAIRVSGFIPKSEIYYGLYSPTTPKEAWDKRWQKASDPTFTHFWVEKNGKIIDHASQQFGGPKKVVTDLLDIRYVKIGKYLSRNDELIPLVSNPSIVWNTYSGMGGKVVVNFDKYDEYIGKINEIREKRSNSLAILRKLWKKIRLHKSF